MMTQLAKQLIENIQDFLHPNSTTSSPGNASQIRALVEAALKRCNLVTREEFDAQQAVLQRTREKVESLESQITELEKRHL